MISLTGITKIFDSRGIAGLHQLDLSVEAGEIFSILGPNGSGKTTLLKIIHGSEVFDTGENKSEGSIHLFSPLTPRPEENVLKYLTSLIKAEIDADKKIQLARDLADIFEFTFQLRQSFSELSAGQKQKVLVASELMNRPDILLLDEPFSHLDPLTREGILNSLFNYLRSQNVCVLWVTHDLKEALYFSDRIGLLNYGRWEQIETPTKLITHPKNLFTAQFMGHKNFLAVRFENGWVTPWGLVDQKDPTENEAILVLSLNWDLSDNAPPMKIKKRWPEAGGENFILDFQDREFQVIFPLKKIPDHITSLNLKPRLDESFLISL